MPFTVTTTVLSVTAGFNQMRSVNFNTETIKLVILRRQASGKQRVKQPSSYLAVNWSAAVWIFDWHGDVTAILCCVSSLSTEPVV